MTCAQAKTEVLLELTDAHTLFQGLKSLGLLTKKPPLWWPNYGTFEVVIGAVLTQNSQWTRVEQSLANLAASGMVSAEALARVELDELMELIRPSGLFKNKAKVLRSFSSALLETYGNFETFKDKVTREWLLTQKGIGLETADSILCYACGRDAMVVDAYTARLLGEFGFGFEGYHDLQAWCVEGMAGHFKPEELPEVYAWFHGMIVEYVKRYKQGRSVAVEALVPFL